MHRKDLLAAGAAMVGAALLPTAALASGYALKEQSVSGQGTSFAGVSAGGNGDASSMFFNPATMGLVKGNQFVQTFTGIMPYSKLESASARRAAYAGGSTITGRTDVGDGAQDAVLPAGYFVYTVNDDLKLGISGNGPWGLVTDYSYDWVGRYHGVRSDLRTYNFGPSMSYQVNPVLTVGFGIQVQYMKAELSQVNDFGLRLGRPGSLDLTSDIVGDDIGFGFTAGVLYQPLPTTRVGLGFRSAVTHELEGDITISNRPSSLAGVLPSSSTATAKTTTPEIVSLGAYHELSDRLAIMGEVQWTNWSRFRELRVAFGSPALGTSATEEEWKDSWFFALGAAYKATDRLVLRTGIGYDQSPISDAYRTPRIPDADRTWLSVGAGYKVTDAIQLDVAYTHIFVQDSTLELTDTSPTGVNAGRGSLNAKYENHVDLVGIQARISF